MRTLPNTNAIVYDTTDYNRKIVDVIQDLFVENNSNVVKIDNTIGNINQNISNLSIEDLILIRPPSNVNISVGNSNVVINWTDPKDVMLSSMLIAEWNGTLVIRKVGSPPTNEKDGMIVIDNKLRNFYQTNGFTDNNLVNNTTYYYGIFPYDCNNNYNFKTIIKAIPIISYTSRVTNISVIPIVSKTKNITNGSVQIFFNIPTDCSNIRFLYKENLAPKDENDGIIINNVNNGDIIEGLKINTTYYFAIFPYNSYGQFNIDPSQIVSCKVI